MRALSLVLALSVVFVPDAAHAADSAWVYAGHTGRLIYQPDAEGDRVMDFSNVGYQAGKAPIPTVPTVVTVSPGSGDDTATVQAAIDQVAAMPLGADGVRGAVLLERGDYDIAGQIQLNASGIVLRGESRWANGTVLHARGTDRRALISVAGSGRRQLAGPTINVTDKTVPVGMNSFRVDSTSGLAVGDTVLLTRPSPANWIHDIGMDQMGKESWTAGSKNLRWERTITRIEGDRVFFDAPLTNSLQQQYGGATLQRFTYPGRIENVGIEKLRGESDYASSTDEDHAWDFVSINNAQNAWVRETKALRFAYAHVNMGRDAKWVTAEDCINHSPKSQITGGRRYAFAISGQQNLVTGCESRDGRHDYVLHSRVPGPNVFHNSVAENAHSDTGPHHRWAAGALFDRITTDGEINVQNRWRSGTGHGWAGANTVIWNSQADGYRVESPPTAQNWVVGSTGAQRTPNNQDKLGPHPAYGDSHGTNVTPGSLYEAQAADAAPLRAYRWTGGQGNWSDAMQWDQYATPAVRSIQQRDYLIGDVDGFTYDANPDDDYSVDPEFKARIEQSSSHPVGGFDVLTTNRNVAFTHQFALDPADQVVHGWLALGIRPAGGSWGNDTLLIDGVGQFSLDGLGWDRDTGETTVGVFDLGSYLPVVQSGQLSARLNDDTAADFALLSLTVATEMADPAGASAWIDAGTAAVDAPVPTVGQVEVSGSGRLDVQAGGELRVLRDVSLDAELAMSGGSLGADSINASGAAAEFDWTGGRLAVDRFGFDLLQQGGTLMPGDSAGTTQVDGDYTMLGGAYEVEIAGLGMHDVVEVDQTATLAGSVEINLLDGFLPEMNDTFDVLAASEVLLEESTFSVTGPSGLPGVWDAWVVSGGNGQILRLGFVAVPEPNTIALGSVALGVLGLIGAGRRQRRLQPPSSLLDDSTRFTTEERVGFYRPSRSDGR